MIYIRIPIFSTIRNKLPEKLRLKLKYVTARCRILTSLIALFYGFILKPFGEPMLIGRRIPKIFVIPDICAVDTTIEIFVQNVYEKYYKIKRNNVVIDVGANVGMFTVKAALAVGSRGKVIAIEPVRENLIVLKKI